MHHVYQKYILRITVSIFYDYMRVETKNLAKVRVSAKKWMKFEKKG